MDYIDIEGYKSINKLHLVLNPINIFIGANGSGKSNFISFFDFLNKVYNQKLNEFVALNGGESKFLHKGKRVTNQITFKTEFDEGQNGYLFNIEAGTNGFVFTKESVIYKSDKGKRIDFNNSESNLKAEGSNRNQYVINYLNNLRKYHFHDTSSNSPFSEASHVENDIHYFYNDGSNIAAFLFSISEENKITYNKIIKTIQSIAPYFSDFYLKPNAKNYVKLQWEDKHSDILFGVNDLSDGTLRFIALTILFMQPELPNTIIIDEPELGLHPSAISKLAGMITSAASKGCQIILATQSTDLISHFEPQDIVTVDQKKGESLFKRLNPIELEQWLEDYTIDDLWKRNIISSGQPNF